MIVVRIGWWKLAQEHIIIQDLDLNLSKATYAIKNKTNKILGIKTASDILLDKNRYTVEFDFPFKGIDWRYKMVLPLIRESDTFGNFIYKLEEDVAGKSSKIEE